MFKLIIGVALLATFINYQGVTSYTNVTTLSDIGSLINIYLTSMTSVLLIAFGLDEIIHK